MPTQDSGASLSSQERQGPATNTTDLGGAQSERLPLELLASILTYLPNEKIWSLRSKGITLKSLGDKAMAFKLRDEIEASVTKSLETVWNKASHRRKIQIACVMQSVRGDSNFIKMIDELSKIADTYIEKRSFKHPGLLTALIPFASSDKFIEKLGHSENTVLNDAAFYDLAEVVKALLEKGADVHAKNKFGRTALYLAARFGCDNAIKILLKSGSDINTQDKNGETPLHAALSLFRRDIAVLLIESGASLDIQDKRGNTPRANIIYFRNAKLLEAIAGRERRTLSVTRALEAVVSEKEDEQGDNASPENDLSSARKRPRLS